MILNSYIFVEIASKRTPLNQCSFNFDSSKLINISKNQLSDNGAITGGMCTALINGLKYFLFLAPNQGPLNGYLLPILRYGTQGSIPTTSENIEWNSVNRIAAPCNLSGVIVSEPTAGYPSSPNGLLSSYFKPICQDQNGNWCGATCNSLNGQLINTYLSPMVGILDTDLVSLGIMQAVYPAIYKSQYQAQQAVKLVTTIFNLVMSFWSKRGN